MKIVQVLYYPGQGGAERVVYLLAKEAIKDGQEVEFIFGKEGPLVERVQGLGCKIHFIKMRSPFDLRAIWNLYKLFKNIKPDVIHTHFLRENFLSIVAGRMCGIKAIFSSVHRIEPKTSIQRWFNRAYSHGLTSFIAVSNATEEYLLKEGIKQNKIKMIYNGIELPNKVTRATPSNTFTVGFVGRLAPVKNVSLLVGAVSIIKDKDINVLIVGDGSEKESLETQVKKAYLTDTIEFMGHLENLSGVYGKIDTLVCPSERETFGLAPLEAMSYGIPVIASNIDGLTEIVKDEENGLLFESGNVEELAKKIDKLLDDPVLWKKLSTNAFRSAQNFSSQKMYIETKKVYLEFLNSKGKK